MAVEAPAPMRMGLAAGVTFGVVLLVIGFLALGAALGLVPLYAGFLLLWYFASIDMLEPNALPALAAGAVGGALTAWLLQQGVLAWGPGGALPAVAVIIIAIFLQLRGVLPIMINRAYMLYVTVMAAPLLQQHEAFDRVLLTIAAATVYFGGIVWLGRRFLARRKAG